MNSVVLAIGNGGCNVADSIRKRCEKLSDAQYMFSTPMFKTCTDMAKQATNSSPSSRTKLV